MLHPNVGGILRVKLGGGCLGICIFALLYTYVCVMCKVMEMSVIGQIWLHYAQDCGKHVCTLSAAHTFRARVCAYHIPPRAHAHGHSSGADVGPLESVPRASPLALESLKSPGP